LNKSSKTRKRMVYVQVVLLEKAIVYLFQRIISEIKYWSPDC
jgi:hypothetical protein